MSSPRISSDAINDERLCYAQPGTLDYEFGALDDLDNPLTKSYMNLMYLTLVTWAREVFFMDLRRYLPGWLVRYIVETGYSPALQRARENRDHVHRVARELIEQKEQEMVLGQSQKDVLSVLGASHQVSLPPCEG